MGVSKQPMGPIRLHGSNRFCLVIVRKDIAAVISAKETTHRFTPPFPPQDPAKRGSDWTLPLSTSLVSAAGNRYLAVGGLMIASLRIGSFREFPKTRRV
ncbi:hypothetical protein MRX96_057584 [Rhipicephalus microplus]